MLGAEGVESGRPLRLVVLKFFVPGHLDGFELAFIRKLGIAGKTRKLGDPLVQVGEADSEGIEAGMLVRELNSDFFGVVPIECRRHDFSLVLGFLGVIFIPLGNFDDDVFGAVGDALATEARFRRDAGGFIELIELGVGGFVAGV